jgi:hypothetical protein
MLTSDNDADEEPSVTAHNDRIERLAESLAPDSDALKKALRMCVFKVQQTATLCGVTVDSIAAFDSARTRPQAYQDELADELFGNYLRNMDQYAATLDVKLLPLMLTALVEFRCPDILLRWLTTRVFAVINAVPDDERRKIIDMDGDQYTDETDVVRQATFALTERHLGAATSFYFQPEPPAPDRAKFAWPPRPATPPAVQKE